MLVHDNVIPMTVTSKEKPQMAGYKQVTLRTVLLSVLTKASYEISITEAAAVAVFGTSVLMDCFCKFAFI